MNSEELKRIIDSFGKLSFVLETYVKLAQTGDHPEIAKIALTAVKNDSDELNQLINNYANEQHIQ